MNDFPSKLIDRRSLMAGAAALGLSSSACGILRRPLKPRCYHDPEISDPTSALTIDSHVHVFNASDLQVRAFFERVLSRDPQFKDKYERLGPILEKLGWSTAPDGSRELRKLAAIERAVRDCDNARFNVLLARDRQEAHENGRSQLIAALLAVPEYRLAVERQQAPAAARVRSPDDAIVRQILSIPESAEEYRQRRDELLAEAHADAIEIQSAISFVLQMFQYRYVTTFDYFDTYARNSSRKVDMLVCHLVDYDWPLAGGDATPTSLPRQNEVMGRISVLTGGRVHCFAAYDPFKEVAYDKGLYASSPLELVQEAIQTHGFIGVKLYPTMGFAPLGNATI